MIAIAQGEHTPQAAPEPAPVLASSHVSHCERATTDYEAIANAGWREADQIATKREVMYAACGVSPPTQPAIVGVGGIGRSVWYPQGFYAPRPPHAGYGGHWNAYRGGNWSGQSGGLNVYYRGKHGGVVINSGARSGFNGSYAYR